MPQKIASWLKNNYLFALIIVFYLGLAFYHFFAQGLINWDEAYFLVVIDTYTNIIKAVLTDPVGLFSNHAFFQNLLANYNNVYTAARPSYIMPAVLINLFWPSEFSSRILSLLSGLLAIIFFYRLLDFYPLGKRAKAGATFLLAASPLFLIYSRLGLSQIFSAAFLLIALYYLLKFERAEKITDLKIYAISLAILLMSHYNCLPLIAYLLAATIFILIKKKQKAKKYLIFFLYFFFLPVIWEVITRIGVIVATAKHIISKDGAIKIFSYSQEIAQQFNKGGSGGGFSTDQLFYYIKLLTTTDGFIFFILFLIGIFIAILNFKKTKYSLILAAPLIHLGLFSLIPLKFPRNLITVLPALYLFSALGLWALSKPLFARFKNTGKNIILAIFCLLVVFINAGQYKYIFNIQTNYRGIAAFIKHNYSPKDIAIFSASAPIWRIYLPGYESETPPKASDPAFALPGKKIIFISDYFMTVAGGEKYPENFSAKPLLETRTNIFKVRPVILDFIYRSENQNKKIIAANQSSPIVVYELTPK